MPSRSASTSSPAERIPRLAASSAFGSTVGGRVETRIPPGLKKFQSLGGVITADHLQDDIDIGDDFGEIGSGVINHLIRTK